MSLASSFVASPKAVGKDALVKAVTPSGRRSAPLLESAIAFVGALLASISAIRVRATAWSPWDGPKVEADVKLGDWFLAWGLVTFGYSRLSKGC